MLSVSEAGLYEIQGLGEERFVSEKNLLSPIRSLSFVSAMPITILHNHLYTNPTSSIRNLKFFSNLQSRSPSLICRSFSWRGSSIHQQIRNPNFASIGGRSRRGSFVVALSGKSDHYSTLNLNKDATLKEIKASYKKLARQYHPDINRSPGAEDKFKEISAAYEVLSDDEKRALYDRFGDFGLQGDYDGYGVDPQGVDPFEIFDAYFGESTKFFGGSGFTNKQTQSLNIRYDLSLSFEESIFGGEKEIEVSCFQPCDGCNGTGAQSRSSIKSCVDCEGRGRVVTSQRTPFGVMSQVSTCVKCGGEGKIITDNCKRCGGQGKVKLKRSIQIVVPPGVGNGATMQVRGEGNFDKKRGIAGDLYLVVHIVEKPGVWRDGLNLYSKISIDYTEAILGTTVKIVPYCVGDLDLRTPYDVVETVEGLKNLQISSGIQPGDTVKLPRMGVPDINRPSTRGDHHFIVNVLIPNEISEAERMLVKELVSLKATRGTHSTQRTGPIEENLDKNKKKDQLNKNPGKGITKISSLLKSIADFLGQKQSGTRFASVGVKASSPTLVSSRPGLLFSVSISMVILVTFVFSLKGSVDSFIAFKRQKHTLLAKSKERY